MATGDILLFLHADTVFPHGGLASLEDRLYRSPHLVGGNFRLKFDGRHPVAIVWGWLAIHALYYVNFPAHRLARLYYGDTASRSR